MQSRMRAMGNEMAPGTAEAFDAFIRAEIPQWSENTRRAGIRQE